MDKIFVQIASYRDPECQWTVKELFEKANHPERIFAGICWQYNEDDEATCFVEPYKYPDQVRVFNVYPIPEDSKGAGWARATAQSLWNGEEYVLQIDSHTRFVRGWDDILISMLNSCPAEKPVISAFLPGYEPPNTILYENSYNSSIIQVAGVSSGHHSIISFQGALTGLDDIPETLPRSPVVIANFIFSRAAMFQELPIDPYIYFSADGITISARLWTHGYEIFQPNKSVAYHYWKISDENKPYKSNDAKNALSAKRAMHLLREEICDDNDALIDLELYGLGSARTLESFWRLLGVNIKTGDIQKHARNGNFEEAYANAISNAPSPIPLKKRKPEDFLKPLPRIFVQIASYRDPECQWTVKDLFEKANHPERIFVGICWQFDPDTDSDLFKVPYPRPYQVRVTNKHFLKSQGACWARHLTQQLWQGEEYTLQIDSHSRFEYGWDDILIDMLSECDSSKPILSSYPCAYHVMPLRYEPYLSVMSGVAFTESGDIEKMLSIGISLQNAADKPVTGAFISAGFIFASSEIIHEVPYDPYI